MVAVSKIYVLDHFNVLCALKGQEWEITEVVQMRVLQKHEQEGK